MDTNQIKRDASDHLYRGVGSLATAAGAAIASNIVNDYFDKKRRKEYEKEMEKRKQMNEMYNSYLEFFMNEEIQLTKEQMESLQEKPAYSRFMDNRVKEYEKGQRMYDVGNKFNKESLRQKGEDQKIEAARKCGSASSGMGYTAILNHKNLTKFPPDSRQHTAACRDESELKRKWNYTHGNKGTDKLANKKPGEMLKAQQYIRGERESLD